MNMNMGAKREDEAEIQRYNVSVGIIENDMLTNHVRREECIWRLRSTSDNAKIAWLQKKKAFFESQPSDRYDEHGY
jgi:hypothetical protein